MKKVIFIWVVCIVIYLCLAVFIGKFMKSDDIE